MRYYANISESGPIRRGVSPSSIGVHDSPAGAMPIGIANSFTWDSAGLAAWRLTVHGRELPGEWIIVDREFRPLRRADPHPHD